MSGTRTSEEGAEPSGESLDQALATVAMFTASVSTLLEDAEAMLRDAFAALGRAEIVASGVPSVAVRPPARATAVSMRPPRATARGAVRRS